MRFWHQLRAVATFLVYRTLLHVTLYLSVYLPSDFPSFPLLPLPSPLLPSPFLSLPSLSPPPSLLSLLLLLSLPSLLSLILHSHPLQQTAYAWDTVDYVAKVLDRIVHMKALSLGLNLDDVTLTSNDTVTMWADAMVEVAIDGVTGLMAFSRTGIRTTSTYHIKNLVPIDADPDCYYNSSQGGDNTTFPWFVETRAMLTITTGPPLLQFFNSSGLPVNRSTLVFSGGNEAIPQDGPGRPYVRGM